VRCREQGGVAVAKSLAMQFVDVPIRDVRRPDRIFALWTARTAHVEVRELRSFDSACEIVGRPRDDGALLLLFQIAGDIRLGHGAATTGVAAGEWIMLGEGGWRMLGQSAGARTVTLALRRSALPGAEFGEIGQTCWTSGVGDIVVRFLSGLLELRDELNMRSAEAAAFSLTELVGAMLGSVAPATQVVKRNIMRERIIEHIERNIKRSDLSIETISADLRCSKRYLHKAFNSGGETLGATIARIRLEGCRDDLVDQACSARSVTDVAFDWGFGNASHFSRAFRRHFGMSPSALRDRAMEKHI